MVRVIEGKLYRNDMTGNKNHLLRVRGRFELYIEGSRYRG